MAHRRDVLILSLCGSSLPGCTPVPEATRKLRDIGVTYTLPRGWTHEDAEDRRAVFMLSPEINGGVAATTMIELPVDRARSEIATELRRRSEVFAGQFPDYKEQQLTVDLKIGDNFFGVLRFSATKKRVPLTEQHMLLPLGRNQTVLVVASIATDVLPQYREAVHGLVSSIRIDRREA